MWFHVFGGLRLPISCFALFGYAGGLPLLGIDLGPIPNAALALAPFVYLAVTSIQLVRRQPGALSLARWLVAAEVLGAVLLVASGNIAAARDYGYLFAWGCVCIVVWGLPNAALLYKARGLILEPAKEKPGL